MVGECNGCCESHCGEDAVAGQVVDKQPVQDGRKATVWVLGEPAVEVKQEPESFCCSGGNCC